MVEISSGGPSDFMLRRMMQLIAEERAAERAAGIDPTAPLDLEDDDSEDGTD